MKIAVRDLLELAALGLVVATVADATHLVWPSLLAGAVVLAYLSHAWAWEAEVAVRRPSLHRPKWLRLPKRRVAE